MTHDIISYCLWFTLTHHQPSCQSQQGQHEVWVACQVHIQLVLNGRRHTGLASELSTLAENEFARRYLEHLLSPHPLADWYRCPMYRRCLRNISPSINIWTTKIRRILNYHTKQLSLAQKHCEYNKYTSENSCFLASKNTKKIKKVMKAVWKHTHFWCDIWIIRQITSIQC